MKNKKLVILLTILLLGSIPLLADSSEEALKFYNMGEDCLKDSLYKEAIENFERFQDIAFVPGHGYFKVNDSTYVGQESINYYIAKSYEGIGNRYLKEHGLNKAGLILSLNYYKKANECSSFLGDLISSRLIILCDSMNTYEKKESYELIVENFPDQTFPYTMLAYLYEDELGDYDKAIEYYQKAINVNPDDGNAYGNIGEVYDKMNNYEKAIEYYQKNIDRIDVGSIVYDMDYTRLYWAMGEDYRRKGNYDNEIKCYQKIIEVDPNDVDSYINMGIAYGRKHNYDKSSECYQKAIDINPNDAESYYRVGIAYFLRDWKLSAADSFYRACLLYLEQNKRQDVLKILDIMKKSTPDSPLIQKLMDKLYEE